jgi:hypothetical protein
MSLLYPNAGEEILTGGVDWLLDDIRVALYTSGAIYDAAHENISELGGTQIDAGLSLTAKSAAGGYATSSPTSYATLDTELEAAIGVLYRASDGLLLAYYDDISQFPLVPRVNHPYALSPSGPGGAWFLVGT